VSATVTSLPPSFSIMAAATVVYAVAWAVSGRTRKSGALLAG
jgi:hypothetical protein